jgi:hypothetical protein
MAYSRPPRALDFCRCSRFHGEPRALGCALSGSFCGVSLSSSNKCYGCNRRCNCAPFVPCGGVLLARFGPACFCRSDAATLFGTVLDIFLLSPRRLRSSSHPNSPIVDTWPSSRFAVLGHRTSGPRRTRMDESRVFMELTTRKVAVFPFDPAANEFSYGTGSP